jgi:hypothetical protein
MMDRSKMLRRLAPALSILVAVVAAAILINAWPKWQVSRLAATWREELESADEARVPVLIAQLNDLGDAGVERLVTALSSPRQIVRQHASAALGRLVDTWEVSDIAARSHSAGRLTSLLAEYVDTFPADARENAAALVQQMLVWPTDGEFVDRTQLIDSCEAILLATDDASGGGTERIAIARRDVRAGPTNTSDQDVESLAHLPGGGLEIEPSQAPPLPRTESPAEATPIRDPREPRLLPNGTEEVLPSAPLPVVDPAGGANRKASVETDGKNRADRANYSQANAERRYGEVHADRAQPADVSEGPRSEREKSLIRLLGSDADVAAEAEQQLRRIGFGDKELALARQVASQDAAERVRFAESIARTEGVRARRWLEMLLDDEDANVRLSAIVQLATSGDAALVESLRRRAQLDPDPNVRRQAERLQRAANR